MGFKASDRCAWAQGCLSEQRKVSVPGGEDQLCESCRLQEFVAQSLMKPREQPAVLGWLLTRWETWATPPPWASVSLAGSLRPHPLACSFHPGVLSWRCLQSAWSPSDKRCTLSTRHYCHVLHNVAKFRSVPICRGADCPFSISLGGTSGPAAGEDAAGRSCVQQPA